MDDVEKKGLVEAHAKEREQWKKHHDDFVRDSIAPMRHLEDKMAAERAEYELIIADLKKQLAAKG